MRVRPLNRLVLPQIRRRLFVCRSFGRAHTCTRAETDTEIKKQSERVNVPYLGYSIACRKLSLSLEPRQETQNCRLKLMRNSPIFTYSTWHVAKPLLIEHNINRKYIECKHGPTRKAAHPAQYTRSTNPIVRIGTHLSTHRLHCKKQK